jgi:hypothetical protein
VRDPDTMPSPAEDGPPLPAARAFVVQLRGEAEVGRGHWVGRIAHVVSGQSARFETLSELVTFIERTLAARDASGAPHEE